MCCSVTPNHYRSVLYCIKENPYPNEANEAGVKNVCQDHCHPVEQSTNQAQPDKEWKSHLCATDDDDDDLFTPFFPPPSSVHEETQCHSPCIRFRTSSECSLTFRKNSSWLTVELRLARLKWLSSVARLIRALALGLDDISLMIEHWTPETRG